MNRVASTNLWSAREARPLVTAIRRVHADCQAFGSSFLSNNARGGEFAVTAGTLWKHRSNGRHWPVFGRHNGKGGGACLPAFDDHVRRPLTAHRAYWLSRTDVTEYSTNEGKRYRCSLKGE